MNTRTASNPASAAATTLSDAPHSELVAVLGRAEGAVSVSVSVSRPWAARPPGSAR
jgi:hypothetical protein